MGKKEHTRSIDAIDPGLPGVGRRTPYWKRGNMGSCPPVFGKVLVFVAVVESSYKTHYWVAKESLGCYMKGVNYAFKLIDLYHDVRAEQQCKHDDVRVRYSFILDEYLQVFFKKHCAASVYLEDADRMLVLDADAGVVNPNRCIKEWMNDWVGIIFYERFFNLEFASGNYQVRNTEFARNFLRTWRTGSTSKHLPGTVLTTESYRRRFHEPRQRSRRATLSCTVEPTTTPGWPFVTCVKVTLGASRLYPDKVRILRRIHGWIRDGFLTAGGWSDYDFMLDVDECYPTHNDST